MEEEKKEPDYHNLASPKADYYNRMKKLEQSFLSGALDDTPASVETIEPSPPSSMPPSIKDPSQDTVITFIPKSIPLEFTFDLAGDKKLKVKVIALQVNEADEAITVILDKSVEFVFPVLQPFYITSQEGVVHKVCYAGGTCQIGPCKFVSFIKTN